MSEANMTNKEAIHDIKKSLKVDGSSGEIVMIKPLRPLTVDKAIKALEFPQPKTGKWIMRHRTYNQSKQYTGRDEMGELHTITVWEEYEADEPYCSECGKLAGDTSLNYCCFCGSNNKEGNLW